MNIAEAKKELARITAEFSAWTLACEDLPVAPAVLAVLEGESLDLTTLAIGSKMEVAQMLSAALCHVLDGVALEQAASLRRTTRADD